MDAVHVLLSPFSAIVGILRHTRPIGGGRCSILSSPRRKLGRGRSSVMQVKYDRSLLRHGALITSRRAPNSACGTATDARRICLEEAVARPAVAAMYTKISIPLTLTGYCIVAGTIFVRAGLRSTMVAGDGRLRHWYCAACPGSASCAWEESMHRVGSGLPTNERWKEEMCPTCGMCDVILISNTKRRDRS
jgi:hypothetical protein